MALSSIIESVAREMVRRGHGEMRGDYVLYVGKRLVLSSRSLSELGRKMVGLVGLLEGKRRVSLISSQGEVELWKE